MPDAGLEPMTPGTLDRRSTHCRAPGRERVYPTSITTLFSNPKGDPSVLVNYNFDDVTIL